MQTQTMITTTVYHRLKELFGERLVVGEDLSRHTTARIGGAADLFVIAQTTGELVLAAETAYGLRLPYFVLGGGSNILVADAGISGLVIFNRTKETRFRHTGASVICTVESGMNLSSLARQCISKGLGGLEWAVSVPGTIGGAIVGNAGAHGSDIAQTVRTVTLWKPGVGIRVITPSEMAFAYRDSTLKQEQGTDRPRRVVLSVELELHPEPAAILAARADGFIAHRKQTQPGGATVGSMFKNPPNFYAGYLIDTAGLKGLRHGNAVISEKHANFFVNEGDANAADVHTLIVDAWHAVREQFGVEMELEVELVGNWEFERTA